MPILKDKGCKATALRNIEYITRPDKVIDSAGKKWIETFNMSCSPDSTPEELYREFELINKLYNKNKGYNENKYYHIIINFSKSDHITMEMAMKIGRKYIHLVYPGHQVVMSVHCDTDGIHFHACVNSVCMSDGHKETRWLPELSQRKDLVNTIAFDMYGIEPFDWRKARDEKRERVKNDICENELQCSDEERYFRNRMKNNQEILAYSFKEKLRWAVSIAASHTKTREEFEKYLDLVYGIKMNRNTEKTISFQIEHDGELKTVRGSTLGKNFTAQHIDSILNRNLEKGKKAEDESYIPLFELLCDIRLEKQNKNTEYISLYDENGRERTIIELVFILADTILEKQHSAPSSQQITFKDADGNTIYAKTHWKLQNLYDSIVFCRENDIENYNHLNKEYEKATKEIANLRRRESPLKTSIKNMEPIKELIDKKHALEAQGAPAPEDIKPILAALHQNNIHNDNDIKAFLDRYHNIEEKLDSISQKISVQWARKRKLEKAINNFNLAQTEIYCYNLEFGKEAYTTAENSSEKPSDNKSSDKQPPVTSEEHSSPDLSADEDNFTSVNSILDDAYNRHDNQFGRPDKPKQHDEYEI